LAPTGSLTVPRKCGPVASSVGSDRAWSGIADVRLTRHVVDTLGGRYSTELGIDVDAGEAEIERWFLAATLFGTRISATVAERTFRVLDRAGLVRIARAGDVPWDDLVAYLDRGGYTRYDFRTATRLHALSEVIGRRYRGQIAMVGRSCITYPELRDALGLLPGWGPVTVQLFLREMRGVWPGADPPLDQRAGLGARHLDLFRPGSAHPSLSRLVLLAAECRLDIRDLESGLVRLVLAHHGRTGSCPGGQTCVVLAPDGPRKELR